MLAKTPIKYIDSLIDLFQPFDFERSVKEIQLQWLVLYQMRQDHPGQPVACPRYIHMVEMRCNDPNNFIRESGRPRQGDFIPLVVEILSTEEKTDFARNQAIAPGFDAGILNIFR